MGEDRTVWRGKTLDELTEAELEEFAVELTSELDPDDPMVQTVRERLHQHRRHQAGE